MKAIVVLTSVSVLLGTATAYAECDVEFDLDDKDSVLELAKALGEKAWEKHGAKFQVAHDAIDGQKMPFNLANADEIGDFIDDVINDAEFATKHGQHALDRVPNDRPANELANGRLGWFEKTTGIYIVYNPNHDECGTAYRPDKGILDYNSDT